MSENDNIDDEFEITDPTEEDDITGLGTEEFSSLVIAPSDWTIETLYAQIGKQIDLDPAFQRRNVWSPASKSSFIESLFLGIPIPQILLSAKPGQKGSYLVLDGKQRLLTIKEFLDGNYPSGRKFKLKGLRVIKELEGASWSDIEDDDNWRFRLLNETQRTAVIRGWQDEHILYEIFYRLNSGSVKLSPMELRMSLHPGDFLKFIVAWTEEPSALHELLNRKSSDPRMNDVELAVRYLALNRSDQQYNGDLKRFLDETCVSFNDQFASNEGFRDEIISELRNMNSAIEAGIRIFSRQKFCRKFVDGEYENRFNRALFDVLVGSLSDEDVRERALNRSGEFEEMYKQVSTNNDFIRSVETTTKSVHSTYTRYRFWYDAIERLYDIRVKMPNINYENAN